MSKKFCSVPWRELTFSSQNQYSVCCKWDESKAVGLIDSNNNIDEHWNGKLMKDLRQKFINGDDIPECSWCWKDEKANKVSARLRRNQHYYGQDTCCTCWIEEFDKTSWLILVLRTNRLW